MEKFCRFKKDDYKPISYDSTYLFDKFDAIVSYISGIDKELKYFLAKPIVSEHYIDFHSKYSDLKELENYSEDIKLYKQKVSPILQRANLLVSKNDQENKDWGRMLLEVFNIENNLIYSNGHDVTIIWGWKFEKYKIAEGEIIDSGNGSNVEVVEKEPIVESSDFNIDNNDEINEPPQPVIEEPEPPIEEPAKLFLVEEVLESSNYFQKFATKFYWLIPLLIISALIIFFIKSLIYK